MEKAFRVLEAFGDPHQAMGLTQLARAAELDKSATQRFTRTLVKLGYLRKDLETKRFALTAKIVDLGYRYIRTNQLVERAMPYLLHLSKTTEETINLTVLDDREIIFISRFMSRHVLNNDVTVGTRLPAYCTASGIAMLSRLPRDVATDILERSDLRPYTPNTTWRLKDLLAKLEISEARNYATTFEEFFPGDLSIAAAIVDARGGPVGALNIAVSRARFSPEEAESKFSPLVIAAAFSVSDSAGRRR